MKSKLPKIIVVLGPTAVGKSAVAVSLAKKYNGEVISADSRQVYRGLDIGSGKITKKEMADIPHHLLDVADPKKRFSVINFKEHAEKAIDEIVARKKLPIVCGGTGFYIDAVVKNIIFPDVPPDERLRKKLAKKSPEELFRMLQKLDRKRAETIDRHNLRRVIRAIEVAETCGTVPNVSEKPRYNALIIGITLPPDKLRGRINKRLMERLKQGMVAEVKKLHEKGLSWKRLDELGLEYRFVAQFLRKEISREEMVSKLQTEIYHFSKRQVTWFKRNKDIQWFSPNEKIKIEKLIKQFATQKVADLRTYT